MTEVFDPLWSLSGQDDPNPIYERLRAGGPIVGAVIALRDTH